MKSPNFRFLCRPVLKLAVLGLYAAAQLSPAATLTWDADTLTTGAQDGGGTWAGSVFWDPIGMANVAVTSADIALFGAAGTGTGGTVNLGGATTVAGLIFDPQITTGYTLSAATAQVLTIGGSGITMNAGALATTIGSANLGLTLNASQTITNNSTNTLAIAGALIPLAGGILTFDGSGTTNVTASTPASNTSQIVKNGTGTVNWTSDLNTNGAMTVNAGIMNLTFGAGNADFTSLTINNTGTLRAGSANVLNDGTLITVNAGGTYEVNATDTIGRIVGSGTITKSNAGAATLTLNGTTNSTFDGIIQNGSGTLGLTKGNTNTVTLTGTNTYTGTTTLTRGALTLDFNATVGAGSTDNIISSSSALSINPTGGNGAVTLSLVGAAGETNNQTFNGLTVAANTAPATINLSSGTGGTMNLNLGSISVASTGSLNFVAPVSGSVSTTNAVGYMGGNVTHTDSAGLTTFAKVVDVAGTRYVSTGTPDFTYATATDITALGGYLNTGVMLLDGTSTGLVQQAAGVTDFYGMDFRDTADRTMDVAAGETLRFGANGGILTSATSGDLTIGTAPGVGAVQAGTAATTLQVNARNAASTVTINSVIQNNVGALVVSKTGAGTMLVTAANTYTGATNVTQGALIVANATGLGTTAAGTVVMPGGSLQLAGGITIGAEALNISGTGVGGSGALTNLGGNNTYGGTVTVGGTVSIVSNAGTLTLDVATGNAITGGNNSISLGGTGDIVINDAFNYGGTANPTITKTGTGTLTMNASNTWTGTGAFTLNDGVVRISNGGALGGTTAGTLVTDNASLELTGGITTNENITMDNSTGYYGAGAIHNIAGANTISGTVTVDNGTSRILADSGSTLTLSGATALRGDPTAASSRTGVVGGAGDVVISGAVTDGTGSGSVFSLQKVGTGILTLSGTNTYTGTTMVNEGTLTLDYGTNNTTKLADGAALILTGGNVILSGGSHTEIVSATTLTGGSSTISRPSGTSILALNAITSTLGGTINFSDNSIATTDNLNSNGVLGGWATVTIAGVTSLATNSTNTLDGLITAYAPTYTDVLRLGSIPVPDNAAQDIRIIDGGTSGSVPLAAAQTEVNSLTMTATIGPSTVNVATAQTLTIGGEGGSAIMVDSGAGALTISGAGTLTTGGTTNTGPATLALINNSTTNSLTISSIITNNGTADVVSLNVAGAGRTILGGANTFTGGITVSNGGTLQIGTSAGTNAGALGGAGSQLTLDGGNLHILDSTNRDFNRDMNLNSSATITVDRAAIGATVTHTLNALNINSANSTLSVQRGSNVTGTATLVYDSAFNTNGNNVTLDIGAGAVLSMTGSNGTGTDASSTVTKTGVGTWIIGGVNNFWEGPQIALNQGTLDLRNGNALGDNSPATQLITASAGTTLRLSQNAATDYRTDLALAGSGSTVTLISDATTASTAVNTHTMDSLNLGGNTLVVQKGTNFAAGIQNVVFDASSTVGAGGTIQADANVDVTISAAISGVGGSLTKTGTGELTLSAVNTYTGATTVSNGTLQVGVAGVGTTGTGTMTAASGSAVLGSGNVTASSVTFSGGSNLHAGDNTAAATFGTLTFTPATSSGALDFQSGSAVNLGLNLSGASDKLNIVGNSTALNFNSNLIVGPATITSGITFLQSFDLMDWIGLSATSFDARFSSATLMAGNGDEIAGLDLPDISSTGWFWDVSQFSTNGTIRVVPEPTRMMLLFGGLLALGFRRQRAKNPVIS